MREQDVPYKFEICTLQPPRYSNRMAGLFAPARLCRRYLRVSSIFKSSFYQAIPQVRRDQTSRSWTIRRCHGAFGSSRFAIQRPQNPRVNPVRPVVTIGSHSCTFSLMQCSSFPTGVIKSAYFSHSLARSGACAYTACLVVRPDHAHFWRLNNSPDDTPGR